jgi:hypothetical protein
VAGIDVGNESHYVAVPPGRDPQPVREFGSWTADLERMADWLKTCGIETVVMQSTGVYWIALYDVLEKRGFKMCLANARHTKNLPGRKSDVQESQWLFRDTDLSWSGHLLLALYGRSSLAGVQFRVAVRAASRTIRTR